MNRSRRCCAGLLALVALSLAAVALSMAQPAAVAQQGGQGGQATGEKPIKLLFLGDGGHHKPADRFKQLQPALSPRGIDLTYTDKVTDLNAQTLNQYDGLVIYANTTSITPE